eukprot:15435019-Alexandrium_andersonii.AAC.1
MQSALRPATHERGGPECWSCSTSPLEMKTAASGAAEKVCAMTSPSFVAVPFTPIRNIPRARHPLAVAQRNGAPPQPCIDLLDPPDSHDTQT